jgi:beta-arrestin
MASKVEVPYSDVRKEKKKEGGTRVFKKASPNGKITVYVGKRDFVDHVSEVDPIDGVILIDPSYFEKEGKTTRKVFVQLLAGFRYGREDLDVLGLSFRRDLVDERMVVYPPLEEAKPQLVTMLQLRLLKKLGNNAYPFTFTVSQTQGKDIIHYSYSSFIIHNLICSTHVNSCVCIIRTSSNTSL